MNSDEQFKEKISKSIFIKLLKKKGQFLLPFFFIYTKIISDEGMMNKLSLFSNS